MSSWSSLYLAGLPVFTVYFCFTLPVVSPSQVPPDLAQALDRIIARGGFITAPTGGARDANEILVPKTDADAAEDLG